MEIDARYFEYLSLLHLDSAQEKLSANFFKAIWYLPLITSLQ
jgi:hypothetical protein